MLYAAVLTLLAHSIQAEEIIGLPGTENLEINFKHYSGFFQVSDVHHLHYWFVESQNNPVKDPLIFWFNGGPGCSSLDGLLNEMGPYVIGDDGETLHHNPHAWNQMASIVYLESPAGVGYSYSTDGNVKTNDDQTAAENYAAIKEFFKAFPVFRNHSVYIMGESYGGIYVPTLTTLVIRGLEKFPIKLKGIAIGNGYVSEKLNVDTALNFAYNHGLIDEQKWITLEQNCCQGCIDTCELSNLTNFECGEMGSLFFFKLRSILEIFLTLVILIVCLLMAQKVEVQEILNFTWSGNINPYDLYRDCAQNPELSKRRIRFFKLGLTAPPFIQHKSHKPKSLGSILTYEGHKNPLFGDAPCLNDSAMIKYMNNKKVRRALHIPENLPKWDICSDEITENYDTIYGDMAPFVKEIIQAKVRVLLYYGDTDIACNFLMGQKFSASLNLKLKRSKKPWMFDSQVAGLKTTYKGLVFLTVRGAGHMAPQWRAPQMHYVIKQFLKNKKI